MRGGFCAHLCYILLNTKVSLVHLATLRMPAKGPVTLPNENHGLLANIFPVSLKLPSVLTFGLISSKILLIFSTYVNFQLFYTYYKYCSALIDT